MTDPPPITLFAVNNSAPNLKTGLDRLLYSYDSPGPWKEDLLFSEAFSDSGYLIENGAIYFKVQKLTTSIKIFVEGDPCTCEINEAQILDNQNVFEAINVPKNSIIKISTTGESIISNIKA